MRQQKLANRYRLIERLGEGGMGCVWRAYDELLRRDVAIKEVVVPPSLPSDKVQDFYNRATREARSAIRLNSNPAVVTIYDVHLEDTFRPWIIMELVQRPTLAQYVHKHGPLSQTDALQLAVRLLEVISAVHQEGLLHRDIKPSNIMLLHDVQPLLIDFGIAKHFQDTAITQAGAFMGTPAYMAPECVNQVLTCPASDLWAIGVVLHFAVSGTSPFERPTLYGTLNAVNSETPAPLDIEGPLPVVVQGLLHKDHEQRLTAQAALEHLAAAEPAKSAPEQEPTEVKKTVASSKHRRARRRRPLAALGAVMLAGSMAAYGISQGLSDPGEHGAEANITPDTSSGTSTSGSAHDKAAASPSASKESSSSPPRFFIINSVYTDKNFTFPVINGWSVYSSTEEAVTFSNGDKLFTVKPLGTKNLDQAIANEQKNTASAKTKYSSGNGEAWWGYNSMKYVGCSKSKGSSVSAGFACGENNHWIRVQRGAQQRLFSYTLTQESRFSGYIANYNRELEELAGQVTTR